MGNAKIRKLIYQESKWTDKSAPKHKHCFATSAVVYVHMSSGEILSYTATKCTHCSSLINARFISSKVDYPPLADEEIHLYSPHKWIIGFTDATLDKPFE